MNTLENLLTILKFHKFFKVLFFSFFEVIQRKSSTKTFSIGKGLLTLGIKITFYQQQILGKQMSTEPICWNFLCLALSPYGEYIASIALI